MISFKSCNNANIFVSVVNCVKYKIKKNNYVKKKMEEGKQYLQRLYCSTPRENSRAHVYRFPG